MINIFKNWPLLRNLVVRDLKVRYTGSVIGLLWSIVQPLSMLLLLTYIFSVILKVRIAGEEGDINFAEWLFCGYLPWMAFNEALVRATTSIVDNSNLIKKILFPIEILPLYIVISASIHQVIGFSIFFPLLLLLGDLHSPHIWFLPFILFLQMLFTLGLAWLLSTFYVFLRDTLQILNIGLSIWFYLTPIIYPESMVPAGFRRIIRINPMTYLVEFYRALILKGQLPQLSHEILFTLISIGLLVIGYKVFFKAKHNFVDEI